MKTYSEKGKRQNKIVYSHIRKGVMCYGHI